MKLNPILLSVALTLGASGVAISQQPAQQPTPTPKQEVYLAPNAPKDKPVTIMMLSRFGEIQFGLSLRYLDFRTVV